MAKLAFEVAFDKWNEANAELYQESEKYIKSQLEVLPNNEIVIDYDNCTYIPSVVYDGGRHSGYDSNAFSNVECVYLKDGSVYLDIEDASEYNIDRINAESLFGVALAVKETIEANIDVEE